MSVSESTQNSRQDSNLFIPIGADVTLHDGTKIKALMLGQILPKLQSMAEKKPFLLSVLSDSSLENGLMSKKFARDNISPTTYCLLSQKIEDCSDDDSDDDSDNESSKMFQIDPKVCSIIKNAVFINRETFETVVSCPIKKT